MKSKMKKSLFVTWIICVLFVMSAMSVQAAGKTGWVRKGTTYKYKVNNIYVKNEVKKNSMHIKGYFDYVVPPLEGFWWMDDIQGIDVTQKNSFHWYAFIRLPEFVNQEIFEWACAQTTKKKKTTA